MRFSYFYLISIHKMKTYKINFVISQVEIIPPIKLIIVTKYYQIYFRKIKYLMNKKIHYLKTTSILLHFDFLQIIYQLTMFMNFNYFFIINLIVNLFNQVKDSLQYLLLGFSINLHSQYHYFFIIIQQNNFIYFRDHKYLANFYPIIYYYSYFIFFIMILFSINHFLHHYCLILIRFHLFLQSLLNFNHLFHYFNLILRCLFIFNFILLIKHLNFILKPFFIKLSLYHFYLIV